MIRRLLVANRGEIALRIIRAARDLGVETVAVFSEADRDSRPMRLADRAVCIGPPAAAQSYLKREAIVGAAATTACDAVHPGYGFLAEDADFAAASTQAGLIFIGPSADAIRLMGDKQAARRSMREAGVPVVPGSPGVLTGPEEAERLASEIGYPVLLKARAGGGGRGMRVVETHERLRPAFQAASGEAQAAFGDGGLYLEKYLSRVRHIEVQVLADRDDNTVHLGERDCTIQRRHQKLVEEAPSPVVTAAMRDDIGGIAVRAARAVGYEGAGTVEFLYDVESRQFFFIEMNTRIQVEHPVTEVLTGVDLVTSQIRIAGGEALEFQQDQLELRGHAIECRINAEDPARGFGPTPGDITHFIPASGPGVRVDTHCVPGSVIPPFYDSLVAKLIVHGRNRDEALRRCRRALSEFEIDGVATTIPFHRWLLEHPRFISADVSTNFLSETGHA